MDRMEIIDKMDRFSPLFLDTIDVISPSEHNRHPPRLIKSQLLINNKFKVEKLWLNRVGGYCGFV